MALADESPSAYPFALWRSRQFMAVAGLPLPSVTRARLAELADG